VVGVGGILAASIARIFFRNALNLGIPIFEAEWVDDIDDGEEVSLDVERGRLQTAHGSYTLQPPPGFVRQIWQEGSLVNYFRKYGRFPGQEGR
jgi:methanogen homoaconitase small subunit